MKKIAYILIVFGLLLVINSLAHSIYDLWHKQDLVVSAQKQLVREKALNQKLKAQYAQIQKPDFIDREAHDKLFLVKPGEETVLFSDRPQISNQISSQKSNLPNWQQWLNLFF